MIFDLLKLMITHRDPDDYENLDKFPKNVQDIIESLETEYSSEDIACINRFELDEIIDITLKNFITKFIEILEEFSENSINNLEDMNNVYIKNFSGKLDVLTQKVKSKIEEPSKLNIVELENKVSDVLLDLGVSSYSVNKIAGRITSKL